MSSRMLAAIVSSWLPTFAVILPMSAVHRTNALAAGILATALTAFSVVDDRARYGAAALAAWVGLMPLFVDANLVVMVLNGAWSVAMVTWLIGPFSGGPAVTWGPPAPARVEVRAHEQVQRAVA